MSWTQSCMRTQSSAGLYHGIPARRQVPAIYGLRQFRRELQAYYPPAIRCMQELRCEVRWRRCSRDPGLRREVLSRKISGPFFFPPGFVTLLYSIRKFFGTFRCEIKLLPAIAGNRSEKFRQRSRGIWSVMNTGPLDLSGLPVLFVPKTFSCLPAKFYPSGGKTPAPRGFSWFSTCSPTS